MLENPPTAKSLHVGAVDRLRLILNMLYLKLPFLPSLDTTADIASACWTGRCAGRKCAIEKQVLAPPAPGWQLEEGDRKEEEEGTQR
jgi:hypothetical protein